MSDILHPFWSGLRVLLAVGVVIAVAGILLVSRTRKPAAELPQGVQTMTGILVPLPISVSRRGTHALMQNGHNTYVVESSTVNLKHFEDVEAVITGHIEPNIDPKAPLVLVASGVTLISIPLRTWSVPAFNLSIDVPPAWNPVFFPDGARFSQTGSSVLLSIHPSLQPALPAGNPQQVAGYPGVIVTGSGAQTLYLRRGMEIIAFEYHEDASLGARADLFLRVLRSVRFTAASSSSVTSRQGTTGSGSGAGAPCGGTAGVLCPAGSYCEITDAATNIGRCRSLTR